MSTATAPVASRSFALAPGVAATSATVASAPVAKRIPRSDRAAT